ncbi:hypothetical protein RA210_U10539 [Rubrivivax sp. A210]|uniref:hypothetical protein n=1 Tax=Rubrivivax sp. A210 TaxID=2772301 RepID=UPI0019193306|nr:hypothetical protein [Rubrivivax sp. A210]CAD5366865.1 hypothetical protein RA210_U10539 [Rubrivivax sp. A210]
MARHLVTVLIATCVCALALGIYDLRVRQPRTPRLALIDIARLYAAADLSLKDRAINRGAAAPVDGAASAPPTVAAGLRRAEDFGPMLEGVLKDLSGECRCAIVAMAAVIGADATMPDFTAEAARRMGLPLRAGYAP